MLSHRIDPIRGIVFIEGLQESAQEAETWFRALLADPAYRPGFGFLRDRRGMAPLDTELLRRTVETLGEMLRGVPSRWATVVSDPVNFGMGRMAGFLADRFNGEIGIFEDFDEAVEWLVQTRAPRELSES